MSSADDFIAAARSYVGVPFRHQGRSRAGVDCIGLVLCALADVDLLPAQFNEPTNYGRRPNDARFLRGLEHWCYRSPRALLAGDLVLMCWPRMPYPMHIAVYSGTTIIHSYQSIGRVVESSYSDPWPARTHSWWGVPGVARV